MQKMPYFVFCIAFQILNQFQNCGHFQIPLIISNRLVYRNVNFESVFPNFLWPVFIANSAYANFRLNLRHLPTNRLSIFMIPLDSPTLMLSNGTIKRREEWTTLCFKIQKTRKLTNSSFYFPPKFLLPHRISKLRISSDLSRHFQSNDI